MCPLYPRCDGKLYVDWFRMWKNNRENDRGKNCHCDGYMNAHTIGSPRCIYREDFVIERSLKERPKHHPNNDKEVIF